MSSKFFNNPKQPKGKGDKKPIPTKPIKTNTNIRKTGRGN
jgi:hypothetical protein